MSDSNLPTVPSVARPQPADQQQEHEDLARVASLKAGDDRQDLSRSENEAVVTDAKRTERQQHYQVGGYWPELCGYACVCGGRWHIYSGADPVHVDPTAVCPVCKLPTVACHCAADTLAEAAGVRPPLDSQASVTGTTACGSVTSRPVPSVPNGEDSGRFTASYTDEDFPVWWSRFGAALAVDERINPEALAFAAFDSGRRREKEFQAVVANHDQLLAAASASRLGADPRALNLQSVMNRFTDLLDRCQIYGPADRLRDTATALSQLITEQESRYAGLVAALRSDIVVYEHDAERHEKAQYQDMVDRAVARAFRAVAARLAALVADPPPREPDENQDKDVAR